MKKALSCLQWVNKTQLFHLISHNPGSTFWGFPVHLMIFQSVICGDNHTTCVNDHIGRLREVFDEATCLDIFRGYYQAYSEH